MRRSQISAPLALSSPTEAASVCSVQPVALQR